MSEAPTHWMPLPEPPDTTKQPKNREEGKTDAEKLAIAVKALKAIQSVEHDSSSITYRECNNALKEIQ